MHQYSLIRRRMLKIARHVILINRTFFVDNKAEKSLDARIDLKDGFKQLYKTLKIEYPKFYKMDMLSKTALLTAEFLLGENTMDCPENMIGLFIANKNSSLETDESYYSKTFKQSDFKANPALFVYTLPNIMLGELCIRYKIKGEQSMWVSDSLDAKFVSKYVNLLHQEKLIDKAIVGWIDLYQDEPQAFLCLLEEDAEDNSQKFNEENLRHLYQKLKN